MNCFTSFQSAIQHISLPEAFTFPFAYRPHPLCVLAASELQVRIKENPQWIPSIPGEDERQPGIAYGKMFGVLVVKTTTGELGYLAAFSGKLAGQTTWPGFVPPVFDIFEPGSFFRVGEEELNDLNRQIEQLDKNGKESETRNRLRQAETETAQWLETEKRRQKEAKKQRDLKRKEALDSLSTEEMATLEAELQAESRRDHFLLKDLKKQINATLIPLQDALEQEQLVLEGLKEQRRRKSAALQEQIFERFTFLNAWGEEKSLGAVFSASALNPPPAGAGECAAPKLLQYAYRSGLQPVAMAEFWWGESPVGEIREHGNYYPACRGKCEPILGHMLQGLQVDANPVLNPTTHLELPVVYEDEFLLLVNKPAGLLSVPGKSDLDSVWLRIRRQYPQATGPLIVHRLDMATSGLLLLAKDMETYKDLQQQFLKRRVHKRYVALLDGLLSANSGIIDLPLRVDLDDRPRQMVCYEHGKPARTRWETIAQVKEQTRVHFYPITGRTHQLRVHAAHNQGLHTPILGDDLYGTAGERLCLHAESLRFTHPQTGTEMTFEVPAPF